METSFTVTTWCLRGSSLLSRHKRYLRVQEPCVVSPPSLFVLLSRLLPPASLSRRVIALTRSNGNCSVLVIPTFRGRVYDVVSLAFNERHPRSAEPSSNRELSRDGHYRFGIAIQLADERNDSYKLCAYESGITCVRTCSIGFFGVLLAETVHRGKSLTRGTF